MFRWRTPGAWKKLLPRRLHSQTPRGELREAGNELFRPARRERRPQADVRAVRRVPHHAAAGGDLQLHPLEEGICAGHVPQRPQAHGADAHGVQGVLGSLGIGPGQSPGPQQHAAEVACDDHDEVGQSAVLQDLQGRRTRCFGRFAVVGIALPAPLPQAVGIDIVAGGAVGRAYLLEEGHGLFLAVCKGELRNEAALLLFVFSDGCPRMVR